MTKTDKRIDKKNYYLDIAEVVAERSTCLRKKWGAVIVNNDEIISTGYNGAPRGRKNCNDLNSCIREKLQIPRGERYEVCRSVHAEQNAIIHAARRDMVGATLYITGIDVTDNDNYVKNAMPCSMCKRVVINAGIKTLVIRNTKEEFVEIDVEDMIKNDESVEGSFGY